MNDLERMVREELSDDLAGWGIRLVRKNRGLSRELSVQRGAPRSPETDGSSQSTVSSTPGASADDLRDIRCFDHLGWKRTVNQNFDAVADQESIIGLG